MPARIPIDREAIAEFCRRHRVRELALFGSVLRDDFRPDSDVDVLVDFDANADYGFDEYLDMKDELEALFARQVDLVERRAVKNPFRRRSIFSTAETVYAA